MATKVILLLSLLLAVSFACYPRDYGRGSVVCVCSKKTCDTVGALKKVPSDKYQLFVTSKEGDRFNNTVESFSNQISDEDANSTKNSTIIVFSSKKMQKIIGFGGAFTDSAGLDILTLSSESQETLLRSYYTPDGLEYSTGRIPIAGTDFSVRGYTYDDVPNDLELKHFALQYEDYNYKIPIIHRALALSNYKLKLFASAWTAPAWMKTNNNLTGTSHLKEQYFSLWADYYIKFLDGYRENNITLWGVTTGNEPADGYSIFLPINDMGWVPHLQARWIAEDLGPRLRLNPYYTDIKILLMDDQRVFFPWVPRYIFQNDAAKAYVDGFAVHFYTDREVDPKILSLTHFEFPDKFILASEGCEGSLDVEKVILGSWERAESYVHSTIDDLANWVTGWTDWNIALDLQGGPNWVNNFVDAAIIINATADEFYKQPTYYAFGHFAKFLRPNSVRLNSAYTGDRKRLKHVVFKRPDGGTVVTLFNPTEEQIPVKIVDGVYVSVIHVKRRSVYSMIYWKDDEDDDDDDDK